MILTGFIPEKEYVELLISVDATMVLTCREDCSVCEAYETVAVEKPMILSNTNALGNYFRRGVIYAEQTAESTQKAILEVIAKKAS